MRGGGGSGVGGGGGWERGETVLRASSGGEVNVTLSEASLELFATTSRDWASAARARSAATASALASATAAGAAAPEPDSGLASLAGRRQRPFVFHNATGHGLSFRLLRPSTSATASADGDGRPRKQSRGRPRRRRVASGSSLAFALEPSERGAIGGSCLQAGPGSGGPLRRSYDTPPLLHVDFDDGAYAGVRCFPLLRLRR